MKKINKVKIFCNQPYCLEFKEVNFYSKFIDKWYCDKHKTWQRIE